MNDIVESLREQGLVVPVEGLHPHPDNPRRGDPELIAESLATNGQYRAIVVQRSTGYVLAGNHTLRAALDLGWDEIAAHVIDVNDTQARKILLVDNRASDMATYDEEALERILAQVEAEGAGYEGTGWVPDDYEDLVARLGQTPETPPEDFQGGYGESEDDFNRRRPQSDRTMREVVLMLTPDQYASLTRWVTELRKRYGPAELKKAHGADGSVATVFEAVRREYAALAKQEEPGA